MVIPKEKGKEGMKAILETIGKSGQGSFLAVLKLFGKGNPEAYNSFPFEGYTLALDFKVNRQLVQLVSNLDKIVEEFGGRIYRTKDSMSKSSLTNYFKNTENSKFVSLPVSYTHLDVYKRQATNDTDAGRAQNRRVEFAITANEEMIKDAQQEAQK